MFPSDVVPVGQTVPDFDPLVALGALGVVLIVAVAVLVVRRVGRSPASKLKRALAECDEIAVVMHPNPDPDAMSSAVGVAHLARAVDTTATLQYPGEIRHQENRAFQTVLDLDLERIESAADLAADNVVLVDHNEPRGFDGATSVDPYVVVDHHPGDGEGAAFTDVRTDYGACATILAEYFDDLDADPGAEENGTFQLDSATATGLVYGIQSDTKNLTKGCSSAEFEACSYLFPGIDEDALDRIANPQVSADVLEVKARAIRDREVKASFAVCDVGAIPVVDAIPQAADELMHLEGVTAVVVFGDQDGELHLSGRSRDDRVHMGDALRVAVDDIPMADAGGHARMGGGQVSIDHMQGIGPSNGISRQEFKERLFAAMAGEV